MANDDGLLLLMTDLLGINPPPHQQFHPPTNVHLSIDYFKRLSQSAECFFFFFVLLMTQSIEYFYYDDDDDDDEDAFTLKLI